MRTYDQDDEDEENAYGGPEASEMDDTGEDAPELIPCPYCHEMIYEEAERCPECGKYITQEDAPARMPRWFLITAIICLIVLILYWVL